MANRIHLLKHQHKESAKPVRPQGKFAARAKPARPALRAIAGGKKAPRTWHVEWDEADQQWIILSDDGSVRGHAHDLGVATGMAIRAAMHDHGEGRDVIVCVQQKDGSVSLAWPARA